MKREQHPWISTSAEDVLASYREALQGRDALHAATIRNYLSDLRHFMAWCETSWQEGLFPEVAFRLSNLTTPLIAQYRAYLLTALRLKPASINRMLVSIKRFSAWATERDMLASDPARAVGRIVHTYASQADIDDLSPQDLRNRFGYRIAQTLPLQEVARLLGHTSLTSTMRYFAAPAGPRADSER